MLRLILMAIAFFVLASIIFSLLGALFSLFKFVIACAVAFFLVRFGYHMLMGHSPTIIEKPKQHIL